MAVGDGSSFEGEDWTDEGKGKRKQEKAGGGKKRRPSMNQCGGGPADPGVAARGGAQSSSESAWSQSGSSSAGEESESSESTDESSLDVLQDNRGNQWKMRVALQKNALSRFDSGREAAAPTTGLSRSASGSGSFARPEGHGAAAPPLGLNRSASSGTSAQAGAKANSKHRKRKSLKVVAKAGGR